MAHDSEEMYSYGECRCCLVQGKHMDILQEYYHNGVREVYRDIFMDTFNLSLSLTKDMSTLICQQCIIRLREAQTFRSLTIQTESHLLDIIKKNMEFVDVPDIKTERNLNWEIPVKEEICDDSEHTYETDNFTVHEYVEGDSDPELVPGESALLARFSSVSRLPTRADIAIVLPNFARHLELLKHVSVSASSISERAGHGEKASYEHNASTLIRCSNMTPFKSKHNNSFRCFYCRMPFYSFPLLKEHTKIHKHSELNRVLKCFGPETLIVYADITDLACTICGSPTPTIPELKSHLVNKHKKSINSHIEDRVIPFLIEDEYHCPMCLCQYESFSALERHMNGHFRNYICEICGNGFATKYRLKVHHKSMHIEGRFECAICKKIFTSSQKRNNHCNTAHNRKKRFKCSKCSERFTEYFHRQKHLVQVHGLAPLRYDCNLCDKSFKRRYTLSKHMKRDHL